MTHQSYSETEHRIRHKLLAFANMEKGPKTFAELTKRTFDDLSNADPTITCAVVESLANELVDQKRLMLLGEEKMPLLNGLGKIELTVYNSEVSRKNRQIADEQETHARLSSAVDQAFAQYQEPIQVSDSARRGLDILEDYLGSADEHEYCSMPELLELLVKIRDHGTEALNDVIAALETLSAQSTRQATNDESAEIVFGGFSSLTPPISGQWVYSNHADLLAEKVIHDKMLTTLWAHTQAAFKADRTRRSDTLFDWLYNESESTKPQLLLRNELVSSVESRLQGIANLQYTREQVTAAIDRLVKEDVFFFAEERCVFTKNGIEEAESMAKNDQWASRFVRDARRCR